MIQKPVNVSLGYETLFHDIDQGRIKIPKFQRDFVWGKEQTASFLDSVIKGYPVGTIILWKTKDELRHVKNIGNAELPESPAGDYVSYVLDGQQRLTSLYAVRKGVIASLEGKEVSYGDIYIDLSFDPDADEQVVTTEPLLGRDYISVCDLLRKGISALAAEYPSHLEKIDGYKNRLTGYDFSTIQITEYPIDVACEIFTRINTGGQELTLFEIMVAKTYSEARGFDLYEKFQILLEGDEESEKSLTDASFETISASTVLQCVSLCLKGQCRRQDILSLDKDEFIDCYPSVVDALFQAVDWLRSVVRVPVSRLLPYNSILAALTYFSVKSEGRHPSAEQSKWLEQYFWWASLTQRFQSAAETKLASDSNRMDAILSGREPDYRGEEYTPTIEDIRDRYFSAGDAFCRAILCLYASIGPLKFDNNGAVTIDNSWLQRANSKNYHHFFPKAFLRKRGIEDWRANSVANITIVDDYLNKRRIRARAPSDYMAMFREQNVDLDRALASHLIDDQDSFGIDDDNYDSFLEERSRRIVAELKKRLRP